MPNNIFISYRKEDSRWNTQSLYNELLKYFPKGSLFKDVNTIDPGSNYVTVINEALKKCKVMIVVIGKEWLTIQDKDGLRRLDKADDFVRMEIATALKRNIKVIPLLFDNIPLPAESDLPDDLKPLVFQQQLLVNDSTFETDIQRLADAIKEEIKVSVPHFIIQLIKFRIFIIPVFIVIITLLINKILTIVDLQKQYVGMAFILSFSISLLLSFLLSKEDKKLSKNGLIKISLVIILLFILSLSFHLYNYYQHTYELKTAFGLSKHAVKGNSFTKLGSQLVSSLSSKGWSDDEIIRDTLGGDSSRFWQPASIHSNKLSLLSSFGLVILSLAALISLWVEAMAVDLRYEQ